MCSLVGRSSFRALPLLQGCKTAIDPAIIFCDRFVFSVGDSALALITRRHSPVPVPRRTQTLPPGCDPELAVASVTVSPCDEAAPKYTPPPPSHVIISVPRRRFSSAQNGHKKVPIEHVPTTIIAPDHVLCVVMMVDVLDMWSTITVRILWIVAAPVGPAHSNKIAVHTNQLATGQK
eukprot:SAG31_NODE_3431_length_4280_cov_4.502033_3_plen_177_part_00